MKSIITITTTPLMEMPSTQAETEAPKRGRVSFHAATSSEKSNVIFTSYRKNQTISTRDLQKNGAAKGNSLCRVELRCRFGNAIPGLNKKQGSLFSDLNYKL